MRTLTPAQRRVYDALAYHIRVNGYMPTLAELANGLGLRSLATVHKHLTGLRARGWIRWSPKRARGVELVGNGVCRECKRPL